MYYIKAFSNYLEMYISSIRKGYWGSEKLNQHSQKRHL